jgi:hypothetical protein
LTEATHFTHILEPFAAKHGLSLNEFSERYDNGTPRERELDEYFLHDRAVSVPCSMMRCVCVPADLRGSCGHFFSFVGALIIPIPFKVQRTFNLQHVGGTPLTWLEPDLSPFYLSPDVDYCMASNAVGMIFDLATTRIGPSWRGAYLTDRERPGINV